MKVSVKLKVYLCILAGRLKIDVAKVINQLKN